MTTSDAGYYQEAGNGDTGSSVEGSSGGAAREPDVSAAGIAGESNGVALFEAEQSLEPKLLVTTHDAGYYQETTGAWKDSGVKGQDGGGTRYSMSPRASVQWMPVVETAGEYAVQLYHPVHSTDVENEVEITVLTSDGKELMSETWVWNGTDEAGWLDLGTLQLPAGQIVVQVTKTDRLENPNNPGMGYHDQALRADAVELVKVGLPEEADPLLINVRDAGRCQESGSGWSDSGLKSYDGTTTTRYSLSKGASVTWSTTIPETAAYKVYIWRLKAAYTNSLQVSYTGGEAQILSWADTPREAYWAEIATVQYQAGDNVSVALSIPNGGTIRASAVRFEPVTEKVHRERNTYYIDSASGDDNADGISEDLAWKSFANVNLSEFAPGSKILLKAGGSWQGQLSPGGSGTAEEPLVIDMYGTGDKPKIDGNGVEGQGVVYLCNQEYWEINNLEITDSAETAAKRYGILVELQDFKGTAEHIYVKNCDVHDIHWEDGQPSQWRRHLLFCLQSR